MEFNLTLYKSLKIKNVFKNKKLVFFFHSTNPKSVYWLNTEQKLFKINLNYYKICNNLFMGFIKNSVFSNFKFFFSGPILISSIKSLLIKDLSTKELTNICTDLNLFSIKLKNKFYSFNQVKTLFSFKYIKNVLILKNIFKNILKWSTISNFLVIK
nr:hypothetical protein [Stephanopyxis turris]